MRCTDRRANLTLHLIFILFDFIEIEIMSFLLSNRLLMYLFELQLMLTDLLLSLCYLFLEPFEVSVDVGDATIAKDVDFALCLTE